jgi:hypothetical protein
MTAVTATHRCLYPCAVLSKISILPTRGRSDESGSQHGSSAASPILLLSPSVWSLIHDAIYGTPHIPCSVWSGCCPPRYRRCGNTPHSPGRLRSWAMAEPTTNIEHVCMSPCPVVITHFDSIVLKSSVQLPAATILSRQTRSACSVNLWHLASSPSLPSTFSLNGIRWFSRLLALSRYLLELLCSLLSDCPHPLNPNSSTLWGALARSGLDTTRRC